MHKLTDIIKRIQSLDESLARDCAHFEVIKRLATNKLRDCICVNCKEMMNARLREINAFWLKKHERQYLNLRKGLLIMNNFTQGPWVVKPEETDKNYIRIRGDVWGGKFKIANVLMPEIEDIPEIARKEARANARLIEKAPELYEMVLSLADELNYMINKENERLKNNILCDDINPPDYLDQESVYLAHKLLKDIDGE